MGACLLCETLQSKGDTASVQVFKDCQYIESVHGRPKSPQDLMTAATRAAECDILSCSL